ncbi:tRNA-binding protein [Candidatus Daviesbacteria bacterium]|nr:tRNA-binding protein [Candidatus Daviesbacteria bacterium]
MDKTVSFEDFEKIDMRVGKIVRVEDFPEARNPSFKLWIDFGIKFGTKTSSAQIVKNQTKKDLLGRQVVCVINFEPKRVGPFLSEVLTLGVQDDTEDTSNWIVLTPFKEGKIGGKIK